MKGFLLWAVGVPVMVFGMTFAAFSEATVMQVPSAVTTAAHHP